MLLDGNSLMMEKTMKKSIKLVKNMIAAGIMSSMLCVTAQASNPEPTIKADAPNRYKVKSGDTLWGISGKYLESPWRWKDIWATNKQIKNPNLIYPNDTLIMCVIKGKTLVGVDTGEGCDGVKKQVEAKPQKASAAPVKPKVMEITPIESSIPAIPLPAIRHWLTMTSIVNPADYENTPYVLASKNRNLLTAKNDTIYVKGIPLNVGQRYGIYRKGKPYINPIDKKTLGLEVTQIASGIVTDVAPNNVSSIKLVNTYDSVVKEGDRVFFELGNSVAPVFYPKAARVNRGGKIIRLVNSLSFASQGSIVAVNLGKENGANSGDVLTVYRKGPMVRDVFDHGVPVRLPSEPAGTVMIFKTFDKISYAYVLDSRLPLTTNDLLLPPTS